MLDWHPIRACFRYVTQKPWNRFPIHSKTLVLNDIVACLAGGRNKAMASRAYDFFNAELTGSGLSVRVPDTIRNVTKSEIPLWIDSMGGHAVIKVPYSNAGTLIQRLLLTLYCKRSRSIYNHQQGRTCRFHGH